MTERDPPRHSLSVARFFNTLVVVGAGITTGAGCGGKSVGEGDEDVDSRPEGGAANAGGAAGLSISGIPPIGGSSQGGSSQGGSSQGGAGAAFPNTSMTAQWSCAAVRCVDVSARPYFDSAAVLDGTCAVEEARPRGASDCAASEAFTCAAALTKTGDWALINCSCTPSVGMSPRCGDCSGVVPGGAPVRRYCTEDVTICSCAYTGILR